MSEEDKLKTLSKKERKALEFKQKLEDKKKKKEDKKSEEKRDKVTDKKPRPKKQQEPETKHETQQDSSASTTVKRRREETGQGEDGKEKSAEGKKDGEGSQQPKKKKRKGASSNTRFILFVGNLPFKYNVSELEEHLKPCSPDVIRPRDNKGFAFVEFAGDDASRRLNIALTKLHHSTFMGRKINVELTAGGGGNTAARKDKIREKNAKLDEARKADAEKEKAEKEQRKHVKFGEDGKEAPAEPVSDGIHPSRRRLVKKN